MSILPVALLWGCEKPVDPVAASPAPAAVEPATELPLVVLLVVDQLPTRLWDAAAPHFRGGLAALDSPDAVRATARYAHASTLTCPGHATISTGASPAVHGIIGNGWYDPIAAAPVYCGDPKLLRVPTVADQVIAAGGQVAAISIKDRSAMMLAGVAGTASWLDKATGRFTGPASSVDLTARVAEEWVPLHPEVYAALYADDGPMEIDPGSGTTFPHPGSAKAFAVSPAAGAALVDGALALVSGLSLGADGEPDLLAISFSQIDAIGHTFTSESWEALDGVLRLDQDLERLFAGLDAAVGADRYAVVLTSDHGSVRPSGVRVPPDAVGSAATAALKARGMAGEVVAEEPGLWLPAALYADPEARAEASRAVAEAARAIPGIAGAWAWRADGVDGPWADAVRHSVDEQRSGDVYVLLAEGALYDWPGQEGKGTSHGSPYPDEAEVPLRVLVPGRPGASVEQQVDVRQVAPTLADLLGVPPPPAATEASLLAP